MGTTTSVFCGYRMGDCEIPQAVVAFRRGLGQSWRTRCPGLHPVAMELGPRTSGPATRR